MTFNKKTVSVIIPACNAENFIEKTLDSVFSQTFLPHEVIVVDDGSSDRTKEIVQKYDVRYFYQTNQGTAATLNKGVDFANGDLLAFLDHDDLWLPRKLELQIDLINQDPSVDMVFSLLKNLVVNQEITDTIDLVNESRVGIHKSAFLLRKSSFMKVGYFSTQSGTQEFLHWFAKAKDFGLKSHVIQQVLVYRTIHGTNQAILNKEMKNDFPKVLKAILDRRNSK